MEIKIITRMSRRRGGAEVRRFKRMRGVRRRVIVIVGVRIGVRMRVRKRVKMGMRGRVMRVLQSIIIRYRGIRAVGSVGSQN